MSRKRRAAPPPGARHITQADIEKALGMAPGTLDPSRMDELTYKESPFIKLLAQPKPLPVTGADLCPLESGPYEWIEQDGAMVCVDRFGHRHIVASRQLYEMLRAEALKEPGA